MSVLPFQLAEILRALLPEDMIFVDMQGGVHCTNRHV